MAQQDRKTRGPEEFGFPFAHSGAIAEGGKRRQRSSTRDSWLTMSRHCREAPALIQIDSAHRKPEPPRQETSPHIRASAK